MQTDKIIQIRDKNENSSYLRIDHKTGAVHDIRGGETVLSETRLYDFIHTAKILGFKVDTMGGEEE